MQAGAGHLDMVFKHVGAEREAVVGRQRQINDFLGGTALTPDDAYISRIRLGVGLSWELDVWSRVLDLLLWNAWAWLALFWLVALAAVHLLKP